MKTGQSVVWRVFCDFTFRKRVSTWVVRPRNSCGNKTSVETRGPNRPVVKVWSPYPRNLFLALLTHDGVDSCVFFNVKYFSCFFTTRVDLNKGNRHPRPIQASRGNSRNSCGNSRNSCGDGNSTRHFWGPCNVEKSEKGKENFEKGKGKRTSHRKSAVAACDYKYSTL